MLHLVDGREVRVVVRPGANDTAFVEIHLPGKKIPVCHEKTKNAEFVAAAIRCGISSAEFNKSFSEAVALDPMNSGKVTNQYKRTRLSFQDAWDAISGTPPTGAAPPSA